MKDYFKNDSYGDLKRKGGLKKIADAPKPCFDSEHNPPSHIVLEPGKYEYTCPSCGKVTIFTVPAVYC